jgi:hypothetical protein
MRTEHFYVLNLPLSKEIAIVLQTFGGWEIPEKLRGDHR